MGKKLNVLYIDIENSRMVVEFPTYVLWDIKRIDPKYIKKDWHITCAAWATLDLKNQKIGRIETVAVNDFPKRFKKDHRDDYEVVKKLHEVLSSADLLIGHNLDAFDVKKINAKFSIYGLEAIDMPPTVDTLKANKKYRKSSSNSLAHLAREFKVEQKIDLPSSVMWAADDGDEKALKKLVNYNKGDIRTGAKVYFKMQPYIKNHPSISRILGSQKSLVEGDITHCGTCGSSNIFRNGTRKTKTATYQRWMCRDCGSSTKGKKNA